MALNQVNSKYFKMLNSNVSGSSNDLCCQCHICGDSKTKRKKRLHLFTKDNTNDSVHCFNCGYSSSAYNYFKEFHDSYFSQYKKELSQSKLQTLKDIDLSEVKSKNQKKKKLYTLDEFNSYFNEISEETKAYLYSRNFTDKDMERMKVLDGKNEVIELFDKKLNLKGYLVIPFINEKNEVYGYQARNIKEKRFYTVIAKNQIKLWGINTIKKDSVVYVFESIFDAISSGFESAIAVLGISSTESLLKAYKDNKFIIFFDNQYKDKASLEKCKDLAKAGYDIVLWDEAVNVKDVNELLNFTSKENIQLIARNETYDHMRAYLKLSQINL